MSRPHLRSDAARLAAVLLAALNLRGAIAAVGPVLPELRADLDLSPEAAGLLTTLPVLCFAVLAPAGAWLGQRLGTGTAVLAGLVTVAVGTVLRVLGGPPLLFAGTFLVGAAMTVGNVLLPVVVKREFGRRAGIVTGLYTAALAAGAALTAAFTAPIAALGGWRLGLAVWAVVALVAAVGWVAVFPPRDPAVPVPEAIPPSGVPTVVWRSPVAWAVTAVLAMQSALYYAVTTWLPSLLAEDLGVDLATAAFAASAFQVLGIPGALAIPALLGRWRGQTGLAAAVALAWGVLPAGLLIWPAAWPAWVIVGGVAQGAGISLAFALVVLRSADDGVVRRLSGMSQLVGYGVGAAAPLAVGALYSATGGWAAPLALLVAVAAAHGAAGVVAGRSRAIG
ncbi:MFS transporter [Blastococcus saxobsidens]|uniref:Major facilitator superfamily cyanate permease n=1 Tax=Blastococcus saxobsidens (strain DD2) TaxID=1146883 RepID=H6RML8_BLASD|nr:MFS transporter [Blastococcus saxobsidens]CCG03853.1 Major facilitator superfamily cyanate permease [Blastococcus saxobsidens DD2]